MTREIKTREFSFLWQPWSWLNRSHRLCTWYCSCILFRFLQQKTLQRCEQWCILSLRARCSSVLGLVSMNQAWQAQLKVFSNRWCPDKPLTLCLHLLNCMLHSVSDQQNMTTTKQMRWCCFKLSFPKPQEYFEMIALARKPRLHCQRQQSSVKGYLCLSGLSTWFLDADAQLPSPSNYYCMPHEGTKERTWCLAQLYQSQGD